MQEEARISGAFEDPAHPLPRDSGRR
jgi:hypothetical protein